MDEPQSINPSPSVPGAPAAPPTPPTPPQTIAQTPPAVNVVYAGFGARLLAGLLDAFIVVVIGSVLTWPIGILGVVLDSEIASLFTSIFAQLLAGVISVSYYVYFIGSRGQTPGKMALKIKVIQVDTQQVPGYPNAFLREIVGKFLSAIVLLLGYFWMLWDEKKQTWHDKIVKTIVIKV